MLTVDLGDMFDVLISHGLIFYFSCCIHVFVSVCVVGVLSLYVCLYFQKMHLRSVPLREFQEKINQVDDEYDILRIFLADKDLSNEAIRQILMSRNDDEPVEIKKKRTESTDEFEDDDYEDSDPSSYMDGEYDGYLNDENRRSDRLLEGLYILTVLEDLSRRPLILRYSTFIRFAYSNFAIGPLHENR